ncbi:PfkB family carbohydrate kinase [Tranquillimonas alkanivorans]|uniref:PfkB family carbohydrate kinase n=1 Tax=Tranquillimonas alkanivorans TaxID=441119 RepID=UPI0015A6A004|nr:PfkB family carbohydrate kinase [Tranquillimonas alkanivorans]
MAQEAGVSVGTVSHVLNDSKSVSERARRSVLRAVEELGYRPNSLARSLIARRPRTTPAAEPGRPRLISVGYISIDYMVRIGHVPHSGERTTSRSIEKMLGGPAANVSAFAAALGAPLEIGAEMVTHLGNDADSLWALEELASRNIDASGALQQPGDRLSRCIVLVEDDGQRTIINEPFEVPLDFLARHLARRAPDAAPACVHFDGFHLSAALQVRDELRVAGYLLSLHSAGLDATQGTLPDYGELLETFDVLFLDQGSFDRMTRGMQDVAGAPERIFDTVTGNRCRALLLTRGADGAVLLRPGEQPVQCEAPAVDVVDATGAGDAFTGIFLASWLAQGDAEAALAHAVQGASLSLTALGAQGRLPSAQEVFARDAVETEGPR